MHSYRVEFQLKRPAEWKTREIRHWNHMATHTTLESARACCHDLQGQLRQCTFRIVRIKG